MKAILLCGGGGTRLWPISREAKPKQFHRLVRNNSLIQEAVLRVRDQMSMKDLYISTNKAFIDEINFQFFDIPQENIICEPMRMDNAAAIGLALTKIQHDLGDKDETVIILYSDHIYKNIDLFKKIIKQGDQFCQNHKDYFLSVGIRPTYPATGFGYIKMKADEVEKEVFQVEQFVEKPDLERAKIFIESWDYLWNIGLFMCNSKHFLSLYEQFLPNTYKGLMTLNDSFKDDSFYEKLENIYPKLDKTSIDYGIVEKTKNVAVIPADNLGWTDVGNFNELKNIQVENQDENGNVIQGKVLTLNTRNSLIYGNGHRLIATYGLDDMIVVETEDAILVLPAKDSAKVKDIVAEIKEKGMGEYI